MMSSSLNASTVAGPSRLRAVFGFWKRKADSTPTPNVADAVEVGTPSETCSLPARPPATYAAYQDAHSALNALDEFFGASPTEGHRPLSRVTVSAPPPYAPYGHEVVETRPGEYSVQEPPTLARMLFIYGFLFFPFWLAGIYVLFSPLLPTTDWEAGKTEAEKAQLLRLLRETEKKWARRCLYAMCGLTVAVILLVVIIKFGIMAPV